MAASSAVTGGGGVNILLKKEESTPIAPSATMRQQVSEKRTTKTDPSSLEALEAPSTAMTAGIPQQTNGTREDVGDTEESNSCRNENNVSLWSGAKTADMNGEHGKILPPHVDSCTDSTEKGIQPDDNIVDDALLSALCGEQRDRVGLLRLEQTLVEFMKDTTLSYIEVGGQGNSIVMYPQPQPVQPQNGVDTFGTMSSRVVQQLPPTCSQGGPVGKQSRFQRLCLHRLADRFNIVRENGSECEFVGGPGLIRLVKIADSRIPNKLLIDLSQEQYGGNAEESQTGNMTRSLSGLALSDNAAAGGGAPPMAKTPNRKMKIMKRSSSSFGSSGSLRDKGGGNNNNNNKGGRGKGVKGKNLSDKEKAYAAARARIFNDEATSEGGGASESRRGSTNSNPMVGNSAVSSTFSSTVTSPSTTPPPVSSLASFSPPTSDLALDIAQSVSDGPELEPLQQPHDRTRPGGNNNNNKNGGRPAAATSGGVSKVTWRNRRQEESDPDFQTRHRIAPQSAPAAGWPAGGGVHDYTSGYPAAMPPAYHVQQHFYAAQQQAPPTFYPHQAGPPPYYHSSVQQQQPVVLTPPGSGSSTPNRAKVGTMQQQQLYQARAYGAQQRQYSAESLGRGQQGRQGVANINNKDEFPALR